MTRPTASLDDGNAELIARLEAATEPSRALDAAIEVEVRRFQAYAAGLNDDQRAKWQPIGTKGEVCEGGTRYHAPSYTFSVDIALSLLPGYISVELTISAAGPPTFTRARLWDWRRGPLMSDPNNEWKADGNRPLPVNICIAALKAREARHG
jgi:hypothetical protein